MNRPNSDSLTRTAMQMADANPQTAMVYAMLDLALAIRENSSDMTDLVRAHEKVAEQMGGVVEALADISREAA